VPGWVQPVPLNTVPEASAFPLTVLPKSLARFAEEAAWSVSAPIDFVTTPLLVMAGGAIGNSRWVRIHESHEQSACLWGLTIGRKGSGKSPPLKMVQSPLVAVGRETHTTWKDKYEQWKVGDSARKKGEPRIPPPVLRRTWTDDSTVEGLVRILAENPRGLVAIRDEAAALVTGLNQYKGGKGHDRQF